MTTVGYGDVVPKTITAKLFTMFIAILGVGSYGIVIAQVSKTMLNADLRKIESRERLERLSNILKDYNLPDESRIEIYNLYKHILSKNLNRNDEEIIKELQPFKEISIFI